MHVPEIDNAHWEIISTMRLINESGARHDIETVKSILIQLSRQLKSHHAYEEALMESCGYPYFHSHKNAHRQVEAQLAVLEGAVNRKLAYAHMADKMIDILRHHIDEIDRQTFEYIATNTKPA